MSREPITTNIEPIYDGKEHIGNRIHWNDGQVEDSLFILDEQGKFLGARVRSKLVTNKYYGGN